MQRITHPPTNPQMSEAVRRVLDQLERLTPFEINNDAFRKIINPAAASLRNSPWAAERESAANDYMASLDPKDQVSMALRVDGKTSQQIAEALHVSVEWVRRTNAWHLYELRMLLYPAD